jgi:uncharacterized membrane protein
MGKRVRKTSNKGNGDDDALGIEVVLSLVLRWGVISSAIVILVGVVLMLATGESGYGAGFEINNLLQYNSSVAETFYPTNLQTIFTGLLSMKPFAVIDIGLIMLIATPIMRVGMAAVVFGIKGDKKYVAIASLVLAILLLGILTSS